jgi:AhpD family alkylhydroperoxidase
MGDYEKTLKEIEKTIGIVPGFMKGLPPEALVHEWPNFLKYQLGESEIPGKYREFMGLAVSANIKCPYCQLFHTAVAKMNGATDAELAEVAMLASQTARWSAIIHAQHYDYDTFEKELGKIGEHLQKTMGKG